MVYYTPEMASKQSRTKKRTQNKIVSFLLAIGRIELRIIRFISRWLGSLFCILLGVSVSYVVFYCFVTLPSPSNLAQYQKIPSITIYDRNNILLYKEWNTARNKVSEQKTKLLQNVLPTKNEMADYLANETTLLYESGDRQWYQKKMMYLYPHSSLATTYINAKVFQDGVVGGADAAEVYFQKSILTLEKSQIKKLMSINGFLMKKNIYARMPNEVSAVRSYIGKTTTKQTGWLRIDTSLDVPKGTAIIYQSLVDSDNETTIIEGGKVRAWTQKNNQLLAAQAILKITEGGENK